MWGPREKTPFARRTKQTQNTLILPTLSSGILASRKKDTFLLFKPLPCSSCPSKMLQRVPAHTTDSKVETDDVYSLQKCNKNKKQRPG